MVPVEHEERLRVAGVLFAQARRVRLVDEVILVAVREERGAEGGVRDALDFQLVDVERGSGFYARAHPAGGHLRRRARHADDAARGPLLDKLRHEVPERRERRVQHDPRDGRVLVRREKRGHSAHARAPQANLAHAPAANVRSQVLDDGGDVCFFARAQRDVLALAQPAAPEVQREHVYAHRQQKTHGVRRVAPAAAVAVKVNHAWRRFCLIPEILAAVMAALQPQPERARELEVRPVARHTPELKPRAGKVALGVVIRAGGADHQVHQLGPHRGHREGS